MLSSWLTLLPPLLVIVAAIITQRIHPALLTGIIAACIVATRGNLTKAWALGCSGLTNTISDPENLYLYAFLIVIGIMVAIFTSTGCAAACARAFTSRIRTARMAQYSSMLVSMTLFIDDYLSILTSGYIMSSLTDRFNISRLRLAYLVHSLAGAVVIIVPISSWVATIIAYIDQSGVDIDPNQKIRILADPFFIYLRSIPFIFYSFLTIVAVWYIIKKDISFGPMLNYEQNITENIPPQPEKSISAGSALGLFAPLGILIGGTLLGLPYAGGYYLLGGTHSFVDSIKYNKSPFLVMLVAGTAAVLTSLALSLYNKSLTSNRLPAIIWDGIDLMYPAIGMVFLATTFSSFLANSVGTGQYLASIMLGTMPLALLPVMFFIVSVICTMATGSAWGNFALMIPIAVPMLTSLSGLPLPIDPNELPLLFPILGAIFSGSVCGDHISPLSETTIMAATSSGTRPLEHAVTQFPFTVPVIVACGVSYFLSGFLVHLGGWTNLGISMGIGLVITLGLLNYLNKKVA